MAILTPEEDRIVIRPYPKVIFLYPVMIAALICGAIQAAKGGLEWTGASVVGEIFFIILALNLLVISFEFSRFKTVAIFFFLLAVLFLLLYLSTRWEVFAALKEFISAFDIRLSNYFYFSLGGYLLLVFCGVFVTTRFDYWIVKSNEILHKKGFLGDMKRYPSPNLRMTKEISDVFEFLILGAGRIVIHPASEKQAIVLDHVLWVNSKERKIQELLSTLAVEIAGTQEDEEGVAGFGG